jgi:hypothetical protein
MLFVEVKLGTVVEVAPVKLIVDVVAVAVIDVVLSAIVGGVGLPVVIAVKVIVTPAGMPAKVNRIFEPLVTAVPLFELCRAVRQAEAWPSVNTIEPVSSGTVRFVKMVALAWFVLPPVAPTAKLPTPAPKLLITVNGPGVVRM